jgi:hypothetical protein
MGPEKSSPLGGAAPPVTDRAGNVFRVMDAVHLSQTPPIVLTDRTKAMIYSLVQIRRVEVGPKGRDVESFD